MGDAAPAGLSKSRILSGIQCLKRLWLETHRRDLLVTSAATQRSFERGHEVGAAARTLWPGGILIGHDQELGEAIRETRERLAQPGPVTIFEATLRAGGILVRTDVLERDAQGRIRLVEVKAATSLKPEHLPDCAIQYRVLADAGFVPERVELAHVNSAFVYGGGGDYHGLLSTVDVTADVKTRQQDVPALAERLREALAGPEPAIAAGRQCTTPYECPFIAYCGSPAPELPPKRPGGIQARVQRVTASGMAELLPAAADELRDIGWPRWYFDFETVSFAVPVWAGTRPYQPLPFQWSCHVESRDGTLRHEEFLADGAEPPMRACAQSLVRLFAAPGPILVYTSYERGRLQDLAALFPDLAPALHAIADRLVDLHPVTRRNYYHPDMQGSWSLKAVLPTVAPDLSYAGLDAVHDGGEAEATYRMLLDPGLDPAERVRLRAALLAYCALDTLALVRLTRFLEGRA